VGGYLTRGEGYCKTYIPQGTVAEEVTLNCVT